MSNYIRFREISIGIFRWNSVFIGVFASIYFGLIPLIAMLRGVGDNYAEVFDIFIGIGVLSLMILFYMTSHARFGAFFKVIEAAFWIFIPCNWIINEWDKMRYGFEITYGIMWGILIVEVFIALLGLVNLLSETIYLRANNQSIFWGSMFSNFIDIRNIKKLGRDQKSALKKGIILLPIIIGVAIAGISSYLDVYTFKVEIKPKDYEVKFNFWANPNIYDNYSEEMQIKYGVGPRIYSDEVLASMNEHRVNLDLTFGRITNETLGLLMDWETAAPNITYRIVLSPSNFTELPYLVYNATEQMLEWENNGTLDQWLGFAFDIEGQPFMYNETLNSFEEATGIWRAIFDYIDRKSIERGKLIEMECISDPWVSTDEKFDGDLDIHKFRQYNEYYPDRFSKYAPMIYRCWYKGEIPYGSLEDGTEPWPTSYEFYSNLKNYLSGVSIEKAGVYIGITNCSCYGRDLPQHEPYTWPVDSENTGLTNLMRDVLICKHFGIKEVTFFLAWTAIENNYSMGGVFDAYGVDFLDTMNDTVNGDPPDRFYIYFKYSDAENSDIFQKDWLYDFSRPRGWLEFISMISLSYVIFYLFNNTSKRKVK
ncbi:MAG: hypothetical protein ACTSRZ_04250 [Promethearchaeota archaeon]